MWVALFISPILSLLSLYYPFGCDWFKICHCRIHAYQVLSLWNDLIWSVLPVLILGEKERNSNLKGVPRQILPYQSATAEYHQTTRAFIWGFYLKEVKNTGFSHINFYFLLAFREWATAQWHVFVTNTGYEISVFHYLFILQWKALQICLLNGLTQH